jgi:hypothetical protein
MSFVKPIDLRIEDASNLSLDNGAKIESIWRFEIKRGMPPSSFLFLHTDTRFKGL